MPAKKKIRPMIPYIATVLILTTLSPWLMKLYPAIMSPTAPNMVNTTPNTLFSIVPGFGIGYKKSVPRLIDSLQSAVYPQLSQDQQAGSHQFIIGMSGRVKSIFPARVNHPGL